MIGVEILATQEVAVGFAFNWMVFWIMTIGALIISLILSVPSVLNGEYEWTLIPFTITLCLIGGVIIGGVLGNAAHIPTEYETQYKVTISDEVQMNDFLERYDIVSQEGKIYTVREREGIEDGK